MRRLPEPLAGCIFMMIFLAALFLALGGVGTIWYLIIKNLLSYWRVS